MFIMIIVFYIITTYGIALYCIVCIFTWNNLEHHSWHCICIGIVFDDDVM